MGILLLICGLILLVLPAVAAPLGRRLPPENWVRLCRASLVSGALVVELVATVYATPSVARAVGIPALANLCERVLRMVLPGGETAGWTAGAAAVTIPALAVVGVVRASRCVAAARAEPGLGDHFSLGDHDVAVLPTDHLLALSIGGRATQIVISRGLVRALEPHQLRLVLRHEAAHLRLGHHRALQFASALDHGFAFFPPVRLSTAVLRTALERSADEVAAGPDPAERNSLRAALLTVADVVMGAGLAAAFSPVRTVLERVNALERPQPRPSSPISFALYLPGLGLAGLVLISAAAWSAQARMLVAMSGRCPA